MDPGEFVRALERELAPRAVAVDAAVAELESARARWPALPLDAELAATIAARVADAPALDKLRVADLALASWAGRGDTAGIAAFEAAHADVLDRLAHRFSKVPADELRQRLRIKLFVEHRIADYRGFGSLGSWLKVTAVHSFIDLTRHDARQRIDDGFDQDDLAELASPSTGPERAGIKRELGEAVKRALADGVATLSPRERSFLRHAHVEGRTLDQIAATYRIHRATVARVLAAARQALLERMQTALGSAADLADLDSQLDLSLTRVLRARRR